MALIGSVSLTNKNDGLYLGKVHLDNLNANPNTILYSTDGANISGLTVGTGLSVAGSTLNATTTGGVSVSNQANTLIPFCSSTNNTLNTDVAFSYNPSTHNLAVANISTLMINGSEFPPPPTPSVSVTSQASNRIVSATSTNDVLQAKQDLTFDGTQLQLFNTNKLNIGRGNNGSSDVTNTAIGVNALNAVTTGTNNTIVGYNNAQTLATQNNVTMLGSNCQTNYTFNSNAVCIGTTNKVGGNSVAIGASAFASDSSVVIGSNAGKGLMGGYNVCIGSYCGNAMTTGNGNCCVGSNNSQNVTTGTNNTIIGISAGANQTTQSNNTICGYYSNCSDGTTHYSNCSVLGANVRNGVVSGNNQIQLGDSTTQVYAYGYNTRSDSRDKNEIQDTQLGLEFIDQLTPRQYKFNFREDYKESTINPETQEVTIIEHPNDGSKTRNRKHQGLLAQEVKVVADRLGFDFGGLQDHKVNGGADVLTLNYIEFIAPMIKAIQELKLKNDMLEARIKILESN